MTTRAAIEEFLAQKRLGLAGASRSGRGFGNSVLKELRAKGYEILPIHPVAAEVSGVPCVASVADLPEDVGGLILVVPPSETERLVRQAAERGIQRVWMQQGAQSPAAIAFCEQSGLTAIHGQCILMFAPHAAWFHRLHRWIWGRLGRLPA